MRLASAVAGACLVVFLFCHVDWSAAWAYLVRLGATAPLVLLPYLFVLGCDALGWRATFEQPPPLGILWRLRAGTEALMGSLPAGVAAAESLRVVLLGRELHMSIAKATANVVVNKLAIALAQGVFLACGVALALSPLEPASPWRFGSARTSAALAFAVAAAFLAIIAGALVLLVRGRVFTRALAAGRAIAGAKWGERLHRVEAATGELDEAFATLARFPRLRAVGALALFLAAWLLSAVEDWVILALLHAPVSWAGAVTIEAAVSVVRIGFFFLPGALGAQELSYFGLLHLYGVPNADAAAAAFVIVKRAKETIWIAIGYALLLTFARPPDRGAVEESLDPRGAPRRVHP